LLIAYCKLIIVDLNKAFQRKCKFFENLPILLHFPFITCKQSLKFRQLIQTNEK